MKLVEVIRGLETERRPPRAAIVALRQALGKTPVEANDYPGFVSQPRADADDQRGGLLPDGGRREPRGHRRRHEARHGAPDGAAGAGRPDRPRRVPRHPGGAARGPRRRQVPALSAAAQDGGRGPPRPEDRPRLLRLRLRRDDRWTSTSTKNCSSCATWRATSRRASSRPRADARDASTASRVEVFRKVAELGFAGHVRARGATAARGWATLALALVHRGAHRAPAPRTGVTLSVHNSLVCCADPAPFGTRGAEASASCRGSPAASCSAPTPDRGRTRAATRRRCERKAARDGDDWCSTAPSSGSPRGSHAGLDRLRAHRFARAEGQGHLAPSSCRRDTPGLSRRQEGEEARHPRLVDGASCCSTTCGVPADEPARRGRRGLPRRDGHAGRRPHRHRARRRVGIAQACLDASIKYASEREQFGQPIGELPGDPVEARRHDQRRPRRGAPAHAGARPGCATAASPCTTRGRAGQAGAPASWPTAPPTRPCRSTAAPATPTSSPSSAYFRDARITEIYEGTTEIQSW